MSASIIDAPRPPVHDQSVAAKHLVVFDAIFTAAGTMQGCRSRWVPTMDFDGPNGRDS